MGPRDKFLPGGIPMFLPLCMPRDTHAPGHTCPGTAAGGKLLVVVSGRDHALAALRLPFPWGRPLRAVKGGFRPEWAFRRGKLAPG